MVGRESRKRHIPRSQKCWQYEDRNRFKKRNGEKKHHGGAMHRKELVKTIRREEIIVGGSQLNPHE